MNKKLTVISILILTVLVVIIFMPFKQEPPSTERVVVDHFNHKYAFPKCYDYEKSSNYLDEVTLKDAEELNYPPMNECSRKEREPKFKSLLQRLLDATDI